MKLNDYSGDTSTKNREGVVEIYYNGGWKSICYDDNDDGHIPDVVCHQLGYTGGDSNGVEFESDYQSVCMLL